MGTVTEETCYEIELRGRVGERLLRPVIDEFTIEVTERGTTLLVGPVRDPAHLHGLVMHFTSCNVEVLRLGPVDRGRPRPTDPPHRPEGNPPC